MAKLPTEPPEVVARMMGAYIIHHKGRAAFTFCVYLFTSVMGAVVPLQIGAVVDEVVAGKYTANDYSRDNLCTGNTNLHRHVQCIPARCARHPRSQHRHY